MTRLSVESENGVYVQDPGLREPDTLRVSDEPEESAPPVVDAPDIQWYVRIILKLILAAILIITLMLFSHGEVDFVYKGF